jgi:hypothetical protein
MFAFCSQFDRDLRIWDVTGKNILNMFWSCPISNNNKPTIPVVEPVVERVVEPVVERVDPFQVHKEAGKIHYKLLKNFFETHQITLPDNRAIRDISVLIKENVNNDGSLSKMIDKIDSTNIHFLNDDKTINPDEYKIDLKLKLSNIYRQITTCQLDSISDYGEIIKIAYMALEYASKQPTLFQIIYVHTFVDDNVKAYSGSGDNISCPKGIIERLITLLKDTCVQLISIGDASTTENEYTRIILEKKPEYKNLINILIFNTDLKNEIKQIIENWYKHFADDTTDSEQFITDYTEENDRKEQLIKHIKTELTLPPENEFVQEEYTKLITEIVNRYSLGFTDGAIKGTYGGSRRTVKKRRTSKHRGVTKNIRTTKKRHYKKHRLTVKKRRTSVESRFRK